MKGKQYNGQVLMMSILPRYCTILISLAGGADKTTGEDKYISDFNNELSNKYISQLNYLSYQIKIWGKHLLDYKTYENQYSRFGWLSCRRGRRRQTESPRPPTRRDPRH